ncbi:FtsX-like permease family protein [Paenibacillus typhae]|uniref:Putative ABC transport system permease protein n=1 Tax=Paenibacillus typhae TaxID=1174501 RepID=A0A1G8IF49_9BACL|nr:ABC transporter permease [Paenibacillus typhae]SDI17535.1 putative ABC transport system permease protein [Paenibacillus typhae]
MTFRQFAFRNVTRNKRLYTAYFLSSMFMVMVFFTFSIFASHPQLSADRLNSSTVVALTVSKWIIYVFSFFFVLYSMSAFLQSRKKEFGLMILQGMTTGQLRRMIFMENMLIGFSAIAGGLGLGLVFAKGILLAGENIIALNERLYFYFPLQAIVLTLVSFLLLFVLISLFISAVLRSGKLITLIKSDRQPKKEPKASLLLSLLVVVLIGISYFLSLRAEGLEAVLLLLPVVIMVTVATYLLFTQLSVYIIRRLKRQERFFWFRTNMLLFSDLSYRMKDNARTFFLVAIISTVSFCAIGSLYGFQSMLYGSLPKHNPYLFTYLAREGDSMEQAHVQLVNQQLSESGLRTEPAELELSYYPLAAGSGEMLLLVKQSQYNHIAEIMDMELIELRGGQAVAVDYGLSRNGEGMLNQPLQLQTGAVVEADRAILSPVVSVVSHYLVVPDALLSSLGNPSRADHYYAWHGPAGQKGADAAGGQLLNKLPYSEAYQFRAMDYQMDMTVKNFGPMMFVGFFVGIVFFVSAGSFLYFRLYSDLDEDKHKFKAISKLGLSEKELGRILNRQISLLFFAPIIVALVHGAVALTTLSHMFQYSLLKESALVLGLFFIIQLVYFLIVRLFYTRQVRLALRQ